MRLLRREPGGAEAIPPPVDDAGVAALATAGRCDPRAFEPLFRRYWDALVGFCYYRLDSREEAEDAASQVFADAFAALDRFHDRGDSFRAWLFAMAHHEIANLRRHRARHPDRPLGEAVGLAAPGPSPEERAIVAGDLAQMRSLLSQLPDRPRQVAELRLAGLSGDEIAHVLGMTNEAVRKAQSRAVAHLRELMGIGISGKGATDA